MGVYTAVYICRQGAATGVRVWIAEWQWDDDNVDHIARHGISAREVDEVWRGELKFRRNRKGRAATHQMLGPDGGGRLVAVFVAPVPARPGLWRAVTARPATAAEKDWWERS